MFAAFSVDRWREDGGVLRVSQRQARCSCREEQILNVEEALSKLVPVLISSCMEVPVCVCVGGAAWRNTQASSPMWISSCVWVLACWESYVEKLPHAGSSCINQPLCGLAPAGRSPCVGELLHGGVTE